MKKIFAVFLCVLMTVCILPTAVSAEDEFSHVTGTTFDACRDAAAEGTDYVLSEDGQTVTVNSADGYCKAVALTNASGSVITTVVLNADIDLELIELTSLRPQQSSKVFTLDGNGHTIRRPHVMTPSYRGMYYCALIASANYVTVKDLTVEDAVMGTAMINGCAVILGNCVVKGVFENVTVRNSSITGYGKVATILGLNNNPATLVFRNVTAENNTVTALYNAGGIAGNIMRQSSLTAENVTVTDDMYVPLYPETNVWVTLNTTVTCDGSQATCIGSGEKVHGYYRDYAASKGTADYYYFGGYGRYWVIYGATAHDCSGDTIPGYEIGNSELVVNSLEDVDHTKLTLVPGTPATCVSEGVADYYVCDCGIKLLKGDYPGGYMEFWDNSVLTIPVDPENHANTQLLGETAPTCSAPGFTGNVYCKDCDEMVEAGTLIPYLGVDAPEDSHTAVKVIPGVDPTCDQSGSTEGKICEDCGAVLVPVEEIPATGHHEDADGDGKCDVCGIQMPTESDSEPVNKDTFRCKMCKTYEEHKDIPVIGWFYTIVHYFVHLAHYIGSLT